MNREGAVVHGAAVLLLAMVLFPALWMLQLSFRAGGDIFDLSFTFMPTFDNYRALWTGLFPGSFSNSIIVSLAATALSLLLGVPAAYALSRCRFRARRSIALWILATRMAPPVAFTIPFFLAYKRSTGRGARSVFGAAVSCQTKKAGAFLGAGCKLGGNTVRLKGAPPAPSSG